MEVETYVQHFLILFLYISSKFYLLALVTNPIHNQLSLCVFFMIIHYYFCCLVGSTSIMKKGLLFVSYIHCKKRMYYISLKVIIRNNWSVRDFIYIYMCVQQLHFYIYICIMCVRFIEKCQRIEAIVCTPSAVYRWTRCIQIAFIDYFFYELILFMWLWKEKPWNKFSGTIVLEVNARLCVWNEVLLLLAI